MRKPCAHIAGCYEPDDWIKIDERAERFRPLLNDEYSRDMLGEICVGSGPSHQLNEYMLMQHVDLPRRIYTPIPLSILEDDDYAPTVGGVRPGITYLDQKKDRYCTTEGVLGFQEYNKRVKERDYALDREAARYFCETTVKYNADSEEADQLYKVYQRNSRNLKDKGAMLSRSDIEAIRASAEHR